MCEARVGAEVVRQAESRPRELGADERFCSQCGEHAHTEEATFFQHYALLVIFIHRRVTGHFCKACFQRNFLTSTLPTLFLGWWGLSAIAGIPLVIVNNFSRYLFARWRFAHPSRGRRNDWLVALGAAAASIVALVVTMRLFLTTLVLLIGR